MQTNPLPLLTLSCLLLSGSFAQASSYLPVESGISPLLNRLAEVNAEIFSLAGGYSSAIDSDGERERLGHKIVERINERREIEVEIQAAKILAVSPLVHR